MADYVARLKEDLVEQFKEKPNIEALVEVVGIELQAVADFYEQLLTERTVTTAVGAQLDGVGDIVVMSRKEAGLLTGDPIPNDVMEDDEYRQYLIYKILLNTCDCTYPDIIKAFKMFWDQPLYYSEDPDEPATMIFDSGEMSADTITTPLFTIPLIRAAGITLKLYARTAAEMDPYTLNICSGLGYSFTESVLPALEREIDYGAEVYYGSGFYRVTHDRLPELERNIDYGASVRYGSFEGTVTQDELPALERSIDYGAAVRYGSFEGTVTQDELPALERKIDFGFRLKGAGTNTGTVTENAAEGLETISSVMETPITGMTVV